MIDNLVLLTIKGTKEDIDSFNKNIESLSKREKLILYLILASYTYSEIANHLFIHVKTVSKHSHNIRKKLNYLKLETLKQAFSSIIISIEL